MNCGAPLPADDDSPNREPQLDDYSDEDEALSPWMAATWVLTLIGLIGALTFWAAGCGR